MAKQNAINNKSSTLTIDPGASGDSHVQFDINTTGKFRIGVDDDDSDKFKISLGSALGTNDVFVMTGNGENTMPLQPAFLAIAATQLNVTGDGTTYTITYTGSERFDQNNDFDGTSTFSSPVTGKYYLSYSIRADDIAAGHTAAYTEMITSNHTYTGNFINPGASAASGGINSLYLNVIADMDIADTATTTITISNSTKVVDVISNQTWFCGYLAS